MVTPILVLFRLKASLQVVNNQTPNANIEKLVQVFFETFNVPGLLLVHANVAILAAYGRRIGIVVSSGEDRTVCTCVYEGKSIPDSLTMIDIGHTRVLAGIQSATEWVWAIPRDSPRPDGSVPYDEVKHTLDGNIVRKKNWTVRLGE